MRTLLLAAAGVNKRPTRTTFMGEVPSTSFINGNALAVAMGLSASGVGQNSTAGWLKFFDETDGKIKYIAKRPFRHSVSRNQLASANVITGARQIIVGGKAYRVRLIKGAFSSPSQNNHGVDAPGSHGSEWNRLMYHVCDGIPADVFASEGGNRDWADYSSSELSLNGELGSFTLCQEIHGANPNFAVCRGQGGGAPGTVTYFGYTTFTDVATRMGWRPLLELIE